MPLDTLFDPVRLGQLQLANRLVMAPMTRCFSPGGVPGADVARYYRRRAEGGTGLIITEGTAINDPAAVSHDAIPRFHGEEALAGWLRVREEVHAAGGRIFPQLWHVGAARRPEQSGRPDVPALSPSGLFAPGVPHGEELTKRRIAAIVSAFGQAAADAMRLGFDGIELHFAHGYLADQFLWAPTNRRTDEYGLRRTLFAEQVIAECRARTAPDFPIGMRFSQWKQQDYDARLFDTPAELEAFLRVTVDAGVDIFHCSSRRFWEPEFAGSRMNLAGWTRKLSGKPVITVGSVGLDEEFLATRTGGAKAGSDQSRFALLDEMLASCEVDLVAVGRALIVNPAWGQLMREGRAAELVAYTKEAEQELA
ncbi:MAG: hypothetical protein RL702_1082 [Pseudomonadota bacterium]|jgi:2,4-dienoyl-CoA reductase-like NADH-dependent reductase (Old Yellow Enzyme family)